MTMIEADFGTLMRQAPATIDLYLGEAIESIDRRLGEGYAQKHPELIATFIRAAASDFNAAAICKTFQGQISGVGSAIEEVARALSNEVFHLKLVND